MLLLVMALPNLTIWWLQQLEELKHVLSFKNSHLLFFPPDLMEEQFATWLSFELKLFWSHQLRLTNGISFTMSGLNDLHPRKNYFHCIAASIL